MKFRHFYIFALAFSILTRVPTVSGTDFIDVKQLKIHNGAKGVSASKDATSAWCYFIQKEPDLKSMVGKIFDLNYINGARTISFSEHVPSMDWVDGVATPLGYELKHGGWAFLEGKNLRSHHSKLNYRQKKSFERGFGG